MKKFYIDKFLLEERPKRWYDVSDKELQSFKRDPEYFKVFGGSGALFHNAIQRMGVRDSLQNEVFDEILHIGIQKGRRDVREPSYNEGFGNGLITGEIEGAKRFITEGNKYLTITSKGPKSHKTAENFYESDDAKLLRKEYAGIQARKDAEAKYPLDVTEKLIKNHPTNKKISQLQSELQQTPDEKIFDEALKYVIRRNNIKTPSKKRSAHKQYTEQIVKDFPDTEAFKTFEGKEKFRNALMRYKAKVSSDWSKDSKKKLFQNVDSFIEISEQNQIKQNKITKLQQDMTGVAVQLEADRENNLSNFISSYDKSPLIGNTPAIVTDTINFYNIDKFRQSSVSSIVDWRSEKLNLGDEIKNYIYRPNYANETPLRPNFSSDPDVDLNIQELKQRLVNPIKQLEKPVKQLKHDLNQLMLPHKTQTQPIEPDYDLGDEIFDLEPPEDIEPVQPPQSDKDFLDQRHQKLALSTQKTAQQIKNDIETIKTKLTKEAKENPALYKTILQIDNALKKTDYVSMIKYLEEYKVLDNFPKVKAKAQKFWKKAQQVNEIERQIDQLIHNEVLGDYDGMDQVD